jgi:hypothetical protein
MKQEITVSIKVYRALRTFFSGEMTTVNASPILKEDVAQFNEKLDTLENILKETATSDAFTAEDRDALKDKIATELRRMFDKLLAHAIKTKNVDLRNACQTKKNTFMNANDSEFTALGKIALEQMNKYPEVLDAYGLDAAFRTSLSKNVDFYETITPQMRVDRVKSKANTSSRNDAYADLVEFVDFVLTQSVDSLPDTYAAFKNAFEDIKTPPTAPQPPPKVVVKTVFDDTGLPAPFTNVSALGIGYTGTTDEEGKLTISVGDKIALSFIASLDDHHEEKVSVKNLKRGKVREIEVRLKAKPLALGAGN